MHPHPLGSRSDAPALPQEMLLEICAALSTAGITIDVLLSGLDPLLRDALPTATSMSSRSLAVVSELNRLRLADGSTPLVAILSVAEALAGPRVEAAIFQKARQRLQLSLGAETSWCPYRALEAFREEDRRVFFGREEYVERLARHVQAEAMCVIVGSSGSGKSSVVYAGLLPRLRVAHSECSSWTAVTFVPGKRPFHRLAASLVRIIEPEAPRARQLVAANELAEMWCAGSGRLGETIAATTEQLGTRSKLLLVVDQLEELFTITEERHRNQFIADLLECRTNQSVHIVATLRADFYGHAIGVSRQMSDVIQETLLNIGPMTRDELRSVMTEPARIAGLRFEPGLVDRLLEHTFGRPGALPLLEFALTELWKRRNGAELTHAAYDEIGKIEGAIGWVAEHQFHTLSTVGQEAIMRVLPRLVRVASSKGGGGDTRQRVSLYEFEPSHQEPLQCFIAARLLTASMDESTNEETIELAHEALITHWERLRRVVDSDRELWLWRQRLEHRLRRGRQTHDDADLLSGFELTEALSWTRAKRRYLTFVELAYVDRSATKDEKLRAARRRRRRAYFALGALATLVALSWRIWTRSDRHQISLMIQDGEILAENSPPGNAVLWLRSLAATGHHERAVDIATRVVDNESRCFAYLSVADTLLNVGRLADGADVYAKAKHAPTCPRHFLAYVAAEMNDEAKMYETVRTSHESSADDVNMFVVHGLLRTGKRTAALARIERLEPGRQHDRAMSSMLQWALKRQLLPPREAEDLVARISEPDAALQALSALATAYAAEGDKDRARKAIFSIATQPKARERPNSDPLADAAAIALQIGDVPLAWQIVEKNVYLGSDPNSWWDTCPAMLPMTVRVLAMMGQMNEAMDLVAQIGHRTNILAGKGSCGARAAEALVKAGKEKEAVTLMSAAPRSELEGVQSDWYRVPSALAEQGYFDYSNEMASLLGDSLSRMGVLESIMQAAVRLKAPKDLIERYIDRAVAAAEQCTFPARSRVFGNAAIAYAQIGEYAQAFDTARKCHSAHTRLDAYAKILLYYEHARDATLAARTRILLQDLEEFSKVDID